MNEFDGEEEKIITLQILYPFLESRFYPSSLLHSSTYSKGDSAFAHSILHSWIYLIRCEVNGLFSIQIIIIILSSSSNFLSKKNNNPYNFFYRIVEREWNGPQPHL